MKRLKTPESEPFPQRDFQYVIAEVNSWPMPVRNSEQVNQGDGITLTGLSAKPPMESLETFGRPAGDCPAGGLNRPRGDSFQSLIRTVVRHWELSSVLPSRTGSLWSLAQGGRCHGISSENNLAAGSQRAGTRSVHSPELVAALTGPG